MALNRVDLPTLGSPTIPNFISSKFSFGNVNDWMGVLIAIHYKLYRIKSVNATGTWKSCGKKRDGKKQHRSGGAKIRAEHRCPARMGRENLFRRLLFCDCCGHPLTLSRKKLKDREVDIYLCTHHNRRPDECPKTHIIYHEVLYPYVLEQIRALARSMKRRKVNSPICRYADIEELMPEILKEVVAQIDVGHVTYKAKPQKVIQIHWRLT